jgi:hypothetical protein
LTSGAVGVHNDGFIATQGYSVIVEWGTIFVSEPHKCTVRMAVVRIASQDRRVDRFLIA